jgi:hypothetical protein
MHWYRNRKTVTKLMIAFRQGRHRQSVCQSHSGFQDRVVPRTAATFTRDGHSLDPGSQTASSPKLQQLARATARQDEDVFAEFRTD